MTNEEICLAIRDGHAELQEQLWDGVKGFVIGKANRFYNLRKDLRCEREDLIQSGYLAMMEAVKKFDPERGGFLTYLSFYLKTAFIETAMGQNNPLFYADNLDREILEGVTLGESIASDREGTEDISIANIANEELRRDLEKVMQKILSDREREVLNEHYFSGRTFVKIAEGRGVSYQRIASIHEDALRKMRKRSRELERHLDEDTNFLFPVSVRRFDRTNESAVELIARKRRFVRGRLINRAE